MNATTIIIEPRDAEDPERLLVDCARMRWVEAEQRWELVSSLGDWCGRQARVVLMMPGRTGAPAILADQPAAVERQLRTVAAVLGEWTVLVLDADGCEVEP